MRTRTLLLRLTSTLIGLAVIVCALELTFRFLPVDSGVKAVAVTTAQPVFQFEPNRNLMYSRGWRLAHANPIHVNNAGFVNPQDYDRSATSPLLAVVGDSYVEGLIVAQQDTLQARLSNLAGARGRVYSFAASGAPLSQYLVWAQYASRHYDADGGVFVVVGNDFDESLASTAQAPGFHHFVERDGKLNLQLVEYRPNPRREFVYASALGRYLVFNLRALETLRKVWPARAVQGSRCDDARFVGNTRAAANSNRIARSEHAVNAFLAELPIRTGWAPAQIVLVIDGVRVYTEQGALRDVPDSYFARMRRYLIERAETLGFGIVDMQPIFAARHAVDRSRFDHLDDSHWNSLAHGLAAQAVAQTALFTGMFSGDVASAVSH